MGNPMSSARRAAGFTLVELMVALAVGLVLSLVITGSVLTMGRQLRVVASNVAAQGGAQVALSLIDASARTAGTGLFANGATMCPTLNAWKDGSVKSNGAVLMPLRITDGGGAGASDTIVFTGATGTGVMASAPVVTTASTTGTTVVVGNAGGFANGDLALLAAPGSGQPCLLFQVTATPVANGTACGGNAARCTTLSRATASGGYNAPAGTYAATPQYGFAADAGTSPVTYGPAVVQRLGGNFTQTAFRVMCGTLVQYNAFTDAPGCTQAPLGFSGGANALASDVVLMHAQYGIAASANSDIVTNWVEASASPWSTPTAANAARVKALRVVLVTRAKEPENSAVTLASCTNGNSIVNTGPCSFDDAEAPVIDLSGVPVAAGKTWQHYRYRVHQAVIPLRNVLWSL